MKLFNNEDDRDKQREIIKTLFGSIDEKLTMNPRFVCDYGSNIYIGENFYANYNCTMLESVRFTLATTLSLVLAQSSQNLLPITLFSLEILQKS